MSSALTRRSKLLIVAGAVVVALLINVAWAAFGPDTQHPAGRTHDLEAAVQRAWKESGAPVRDVSCTEAGGWTCQIKQTRGPVVECSLGSARPELFVNPKPVLAVSCRSR
jgi:hypothetical protein